MKRLLLFVILLLVVCAAGATWFYLGVNRPYKGYAEPEQFVEIPPGSGTAAIARRLADAGVVTDVNTFRLALWVTGQGRRLQAGEYRFDHPLSARQVAEKIGRGEVYVHPITFREGLTIKQMAELYESRGFGPAKDFVEAAKNVALVQAITTPDARAKLSTYGVVIAPTTPEELAAAQTAEMKMWIEPVKASGYTGE